MARIYVGNLPLDIRERDVDDLFYKYGRIRDIEVKTPSRPPAFAFVEFDNLYDAEDAVRGRDGVMFEGARLRVEMSRGTAATYGYDKRGGGGGAGKAPPRNLRRSDYRVIISGLPKSASWQDLKDYFRQAGEIVYTDVDRQGGGIVEFANEDDRDYAIKKFDDTEFSNPFDRGYIRVMKPRDQMTSEEREKEDERERRERSRSRSRDRRKSRSRSRSGSRRQQKSKSRSRSRSPADDGKDEVPKGEAPKEGNEEAATEEKKEESGEAAMTN
uniref:RRM domain-containing protein n=1 Tax=Hanusia phi TaxID=3032 RepID=A0A7S0I1L9_9CRYP|mmetsp:Transcript_8078/g.18458  ORF Transcript_8078/g.18458 Transcript_8078/m.18458 type:complete len:271 (+) Transcript_8078:39-851(+)